MAKVRFIRTTIVEIELNPEYYPESLTTEEMAQFDIEQVKESGDYEALFSDNVKSDEIKFEIIEK